MMIFFESILRFCVGLNSTWRRKMSMSLLISLGVRELIRLAWRMTGICQTRMTESFYEVALSDADAYLVTGNLNHFPCVPKVVTAAQMMDILEGN